MSKYKIDHWKVMCALAKEAPKRPTMTTEDVLKAAYGGRADKERTVRNAYRMLRENEHVEICERGEYRLTPAGVSEYQRLKKEKFQPEAPKRRAPVTKKAKAGKKAKATKRPSPPKAKPKAVKAKPKRPSPPKRPSAPKPAAKPAAKADSKSNGAGANGGAKKRPSPPKKPAESKPAQPPAKPVTTGSTLEF